MARTLKPWNTYSLAPTGQKCRVIAFNENGTVRVLIVDRAMRPQWEVFGIRPSDLLRVR